MLFISSSWSRSFLGLTASKQVCGMVHAHNGVTAPHSAQGPCARLVCAHLNTATPNFFIHEIFDEFNDDWSRVILTICRGEKWLL
jgi:galactonate dehydratase